MKPVDSFWDTILEPVFNAGRAEKFEVLLELFTTTRDSEHNARQPHGDSSPLFAPGALTTYGQESRANPLEERSGHHVR